MNKRIDRAMRGPSWTEVILGALLSVVLGVIVGVLLLVLRPVVVAKDTPKEIDPKAVYFIEGPRDGGKAAQAQAKRRAFIAGQSVTITDNELNALVTPAGGASASAAPKAPIKKADGKDKKGTEKGGASDGSGEALAIGSANFRIHSGVMQVGVPVTLNVLGLEQKVIAQARGGFLKKGDLFVYEPDVLYLGSCPVQRLPLVAGYVRNKLLAAETLPDDVKASWMKLNNVAIDGNALKLTMP